MAGGGYPASWAPHSAALEEWQQGDVVLDVPITWIMPVGSDPIAGAENLDHYATALAALTRRQYTSSFAARPATSVLKGQEGATRSL